MALCRPLYLDSNSNLRVMDENHLDKLRTEVVRQYALNPSVVLTYDSMGDSGSSIGTITDTRLQAGIGDASTRQFASEAALPPPTFVDVSWDKISSSLVSLTPSLIANGYPLYFNGTTIQSMDSDDVKDTLIYPAIDRIVSGSLAESDAGGTYFISTIDSDSAGSLITTQPIFTDTRADSANYSQNDLNEVLDQPHDIQEYFLFQMNPPQPQDFPRPLYINDSANIQEYQDSDWKNRIGDIMKTTCQQDPNGYAIRYHIDSALSSGGTMGTGMINTRLSGSDGLYLTRQIHINDYRAQKIPYGIPQTDDTYYLKLRKQ